MLVDSIIIYIVYKVDLKKHMCLVHIIRLGHTESNEDST